MTDNNNNSSGSSGSEDNSNNNSINYNDILFFKILRNKYILKIIFNKAKELNVLDLMNYLEKWDKCIYKEMIKNIENTQCVAYNEIKKKRIINYNLVPYSTIFTKGLVEMFKDRLKMKIKFRENEPFQSIHRHFLNFVQLYKHEISNEQFKEFYQLNREFLNKNIPSNVMEESSDIFQILVERRQYEKLLIVYEIEKESIENEKKHYIKIKKEREKDILKFHNEFGYNIDIVPENTNSYNSPFGIYFNSNLVKVALKFSSLEIIKFLYENLELDFKRYGSNVFLWAVEGDCRNQIFNYLLDNGFTFPKSFCTSNYINYFDKILLLDYSTFQRAFIKENSPMFYKNDFYSFSEKIQDYSFSQIKGFPSQLSFIQNAVHSHYINSKSIKSLMVLKYIKKLIKFNDNCTNGDNRITINTINKFKSKYKLEIEQEQEQKVQLQEEEEEEKKPKLDKSLFKRLSSYFFSAPNSQNNNNKDNNNSDALNSNNCQDLEIFKYYTNIDYENFNLEKEIKRLYLFHFIKNNLPDEIRYFRCLVFYSCKFKEFNLVKDYYDSNKPSESYGSLVSNIKASMLTKYLYEAIGYYNEIDFYIFCKENELFDYSENKHLRIHDVRVSLNPDFEKCLKLLELFKNYNDPYFKGLLLSVLNNQSIEISTIKQIMTILDQHIKDNNIHPDNYIEAKLISYDSTFFYIYHNYYNLFLDWELSYKLKNYKLKLLLNKTN